MSFIESGTNSEFMQVDFRVLFEERMLDWNREINSFSGEDIRTNLIFPKNIVFWGCTLEVFISLYHC